MGGRGEGGGGRGRGGGGGKIVLPVPGFPSWLILRLVFVSPGFPCVTTRLVAVIHLQLKVFYRSSLTYPLSTPPFAPFPVPA